LHTAEICLLTNCQRTASVKAQTYCNVYSLSVQHFDAVLRQYPDMRRTMAAVAAERLNSLGRDASGSLSMLDPAPDGGSGHPDDGDARPPCGTTVTPTSLRSSLLSDQQLSVSPTVSQ